MMALMARPEYLAIIPDIAGMIQTSRLVLAC